MTTVTLNNGVVMPMIGLGTLRMAPSDVARIIPEALDAGYRLIDTASRYYNEEAVGEALSRADVPREELFITTKLWFKDHGYKPTLEAFDTSLNKLGLEYIDLYLIHQPFNDYFGSWRAMEDLLAEGRVRAIGVSNFFDDRYFDLVVHNGVVPAISQRETHPFNQQIATQALLAEHGTLLQAWAPLAQGDPELVGHPVLQQIAGSLGKSVAQIIIRWLVQRGIPVVTKSLKMGRVRENVAVFDFELSDEHMGMIAELDRAQLVTGYGHSDPRMLERLLALA